MAWFKREKGKKRKDRSGDVPGMIMLTVVLAYSAVMVFDGYMLCRSGLIKGPNYVCPEKPQEIVYLTGGGAGTTVATAGEKITYFHDVLKMAFDYPGEWGSVSVREEMGVDQSGSDIIIGLMVSFPDMAKQSGGGLFLHASNPNISVANRRLDYWGSEGVKVSSAYDLMKWCEGKDDCSTFTNSNGVSIVKQKMNPSGTAGGSSYLVYYLHNPRGGYNGVALSAERLDVKFGAAALQKGFDGLIDSIRLLD